MIRAVNSHKATRSAGKAVSNEPHAQMNVVYKRERQQLGPFGLRLHLS